MANIAKPKVNQDALKELGKHIAKCPWHDKVYTDFHYAIDVDRPDINLLFELAEERITQLEELGFKTLAKRYMLSLERADDAISYAKWASQLKLLTQELIKESNPEFWNEFFDMLGDIPVDEAPWDTSSYQYQRIPF